MKWPVPCLPRDGSDRWGGSLAARLRAACAEAGSDNPDEVGRTGQPQDTDPSHEEELDLLECAKRLRYGKEHVRTL